MRQHAWRDDTPDCGGSFGNVVLAVGLLVLLVLWLGLLGLHAALADSPISTGMVRS